MPAPFDCDEEFEHWFNKWTPEKMAWCCHEVGRGCAATTTTLHCNGDEQAQELWTPVKRAWCCENMGKGCTTTTTERFDCSAGKNNYEAGWSDMKKRYCCKHYSTACQPEMLDIGHFDCKAGEPNWVHDWSPKKKQWCCDYKGVHCYDCNVIAWAEKPRAWCCRYEGVCETTTTEPTNMITQIQNVIMR